MTTNIQRRHNTRAHVVDDVKGIIEGYVFVWGSPDQVDSYGTWVDKSRPPEMDLDLLPIALRYEHGMDGSMRQYRIGEIFKFWFDDIGIAFRAQADTSLENYDRIVDEIKNGTPNGPLRTSSGSVDYLTEFRIDGSFKMWTLTEVTLTAFASESRMPQATIRSQRQSSTGGTDTQLQTGYRQEAHNENEETDNPISNDVPNDNEDEIMLEELQAIIAALPEGSDITAVMAALLEAEGIELADLEAAVAMLGTPPEEGDAERNDMPIGEQLVNALTQIVEQRNVENTATDLAEAQAEVRSLGLQLGLANTARSAPPPAQGQQGDATNGGNSSGRITGMNNRRFGHLNSRQLGYGYQLLRSSGETPSEDYMLHLGGKTIELVEKGDGGFNDKSNYATIRSNLKGANRADEIMYTTNTGKGAEWIPENWVSEVWEVVRQGRIMEALQRDMWVLEASGDAGSSVKVPLEGSDPTWYSAAENKSLAADGNPGPLVDASAIGTANVEVTPKKAMARVFVSTEMIEDSIVPVLAQLDRQFNESAQDAIENLYLNGDTETATNTNINLIDGTPASGTSAPMYLVSDGVLKYALVTGTNTSDDGGALSSQDFLDARGLLPDNLIVDPADMLYISDNRTQLKALSLIDLKDATSFSGATIENGTLTGIWGTPYMVSKTMALANTAGLIPAAGGTLGRIVCIVPKYWAMVWKRQIRFNTMEDIDTDTTKVVASLRVAFQARGAGASTCIYNLTI